MHHEIGLFEDDETDNQQEQRNTKLDSDQDVFQADAI
jgi:hypothetical protein